MLLAQQEAFLAKFERPKSLEDAESAVKRHDTFMTTMAVNDEKINQVLSSAERLCQDGNYASDKIHKKAENIAERSANNRVRTKQQEALLSDALRLQQFLRDCEEMREFIQDKTIAAEDESVYRTAKTAHQKWTRHQAFEAELAANKSRLDNLICDGQDLVAEKPEFADDVRQPLRSLSEDWERLEKITKEKGDKLFDANRQAIYEQTCDDIDNWVTELETAIETRETGEDLTSINILIQKQQAIENQMQVKAAQVQDLAPQAEKLLEIVPERAEQIYAKRANVADRFARLRAPLEERAGDISKKAKALQFVRDVEDELEWIDEKHAIAQSPNVGSNLYDVTRLRKKAQTLRTEVDNHAPRIETLYETGKELLDGDYEPKEKYSGLLHDLQGAWQQLNDALGERDRQLAVSEAAQQYLYDANEAEAWMSEQELHLLSDERAKDPQAAEAMVTKHNAAEANIDEFANTIRDLDERKEKLAEENNPLA